MKNRCSRCGGTGKVTRGQIVNGVCYGCGGSGVRVPATRLSSRSRKAVQYALADAAGHHVAINTDRAVLESLLTSSTHIEEM